MNKIKRTKGITLISLVITIVILIILATISISAIFGDNGLITSAQKARKEQEKAEARERLELVLADAFTEKKVTEKYTEEEFLEKHLEEFVYEREPDSEIFNEDGQDLISLNGHVFELDRSVPQLGEWVGEKGNLLPAIRSIEVTSKTDTSAMIQVTTARTEGVSGIEYRYSIKKQNEGDENYSQVTTKSENTNEFTELENTGAYTIYKAKVELLKDGKVVDTETIDILLGKLEKGVVRFEDEKWENGKASVKILTDKEGYTLQYQIGGIGDNSWINIASGSTISGLKLNETVYGRLWDGINESDPASFEVKDTVNPTINNFIVTDTTWNSIKVIVNASDEQSGLAKAETYKYYLNSEESPRETSTSNIYSFMGLTAETSYTLKVLVMDQAGNQAMQTITTSTTKKIATNVNELEEGDYVIYPSTQGDWECRVLYDSLSEYGTQIVTSDTIDDVTLGYGDLTASGTNEYKKALNSYKNAINTLNDVANKYNNSTYSTARCIGSVPDNPTANTGENYKEDFNQMTTLKIRNIDKSYWLADPYNDSSSGSAYQPRKVRYVKEEGNYTYSTLCYSKRNVNNTDYVGYSYTRGIRPVLILKSNIKITGGNGTEELPYTLGV